MEPSRGHNRSRPQTRVNQLTAMADGNSSYFWGTNPTPRTGQGIDKRRGPFWDEKKGMQESKCWEAVDEIKKHVGIDDYMRRPLRIAIIGLQGAGKSSFLNSVAAALSRDKWREHAAVGLRKGAQPITVFTKSYKKCGCAEKYPRVLLPTLIDVAGATDADTMEEPLRQLFYGHIKEEKSFREAYQFCESHTKEQIRSQYRTAYPEMRVDRVIVVASAADKSPEKLMECVMRAAKPDDTQDENEQRVIPVFGVITKKDKISGDSAEMTEAFKLALGLNNTTFLCCKNYCDDLDPEGDRAQEVDPAIDLPILKFMVQVCDPARAVLHNDVDLSSMARGGVFVKTFVVAFVLFFLLLWGFSPSKEAVEACRRGAGSRDQSERCGGVTVAGGVWASLVLALLSVAGLYYIEHNY